MASEFDDKEPSLKLESVERRGEPRGIMRDLCVVTEDGLELPVLEASRKGVFVAVDDPEDFRLRATHNVTVRRKSDQVSFSCRTEVARKEIHPRCGVALRIIRLTPVAEETLKQLLEG